MDDLPLIVSIPRADPVFSIWVWRSDSQTLARMRPKLEALAAANEHNQCLLYVAPDTCINHEPPRCLPCCVADLLAM